MQGTGPVPTFAPPFVPVGPVDKPALREALGGARIAYLAAPSEITVRLRVTAGVLPSSSNSGP